MAGDTGSIAADAAVAATCAKYGSDRRHGDHVATLARQIFEAFSPLHMLDGQYERILVHAALLHDIGYFVAARGHHRHGAYLVLYDQEMRDYPLGDRELLAGIVRNHRKRPKPAPKDWPKERKQALLWLSALLRVADSLDYEHNQAAGIAQVRSRPGGFEIVVRGFDPRPFAVRLADRADLLQSLCGGSIRITGTPR